METTEITIEALISADRGRVWEYWTGPEHITKWNFASDDWHCPEAQNDMRVGGKYRARMEAKDGSVGFDLEAIYDEIAMEEKIVYTMLDGRKVVTLFEDTGGNKRVTTTFEAEKENPVDMQKMGWQAILDNFKKYTESG